MASIRKKSAWVITLICGGLAFSGYGLYLANRRPRVVEKIVEKPVEKIVEKLVPQDCPKSVASKHQKAPTLNAPTTSQTQSGHDNTQVGPITTGPCSNVNVQGTASQTMNCGPPDPTISWSLDSTQDKVRYGKKLTWLSFSVDHTLEMPAFVAKCDRPCKTFSAGPSSGGFINFSVATYKDPTLAAFIFNSPRPLGAGIKCFWAIESLDDVPVQISAVQIIPKSSLP